MLCEFKFAMRFAWPSPQQCNLKPEFHVTTVATLKGSQRSYLNNQRILLVDKSLVGFGVKVPVEDSELVV